MSETKKFLQFELWKDCKNGCKFCFNRGLKDIDKIESLDYVLKQLDDIEDYNEIGIIGGEFFDGLLSDKTVRDKFFLLHSKVQDYMLEGKIEKMYIATSMIFNNFDDIYDVVKTYEDKNLIDKLLICTSYDTIYRFRDYAAKKLWESNMKELKDVFPKLKLHVEIIITQDFIDEVLLDLFDIEQFKLTFNVEIDYLEPNTGSFYNGKEEFDKNLPRFLPKRKDFLRFLTKTCIVDKSIPLFKLFSKTIRSDTIHLVLNGKHVKIESRRKRSRTAGLDLPILPRFGYVDSNIDIADDVLQLRNLYNGQA